MPLLILASGNQMAGFKERSQLSKVDWPIIISNSDLFMAYPIN
jgi:hypothetical protein